MSTNSTDFVDYVDRIQFRKTRLKMFERNFSFSCYLRYACHIRVTAQQAGFDKVLKLLIDDENQDIMKSVSIIILYVIMTINNNKFMTMSPEGEISPCI